MRRHLTTHYLILAAALLMPPTLAQETETQLLQQEAAEAEAREASIRHLQDAIAELESQLGPYDPALIEMRSDLGRMYQEAERHGEAADAYAQALQSVRISDGLNSPRQEPVLEALIASHFAAGNWQAVDDGHHLLFLIRRNLYAASDPAYIEAVLDIGEWRLQVSQHNLLEQSSSAQAQMMEETRELYQKAIEQLAADAGPDAPGEAPATLASLLYGKARTEHDLAWHVLQMPAYMFQGQGSRYRQQVVCRYIGSTADEGAAQPRMVKASWQLAQAAPAPRPPVQRVCTTYQFEDPNFYSSQSNQKRMLLDRAMASMRRSMEELAMLLGEDAAEDAAKDIAEPGEGADNEDFLALPRQQLEELNQLYQSLWRESRRGSSRWGF